MSATTKHYWVSTNESGDVVGRARNKNRSLRRGRKFVGNKNVTANRCTRALYREMFENGPISAYNSYYEPDGTEVYCLNPVPPTTLEELVNVLRETDRCADFEDYEDLSERTGIAMNHGKLDWTELPTFGGEEPSSTLEVWSWDADSLLVGTCTDDLSIVARDLELEGASLAALRDTAIGAGVAENRELDHGYYR